MALQVNIESSDHSVCQNIVDFLNSTGIVCQNKRQLLDEDTIKCHITFNNTKDAEKALYSLSIFDYKLWTKGPKISPPPPFITS